MILPEVKLEFVIEIAERLRSSCESNEVIFNQDVLHTTVSVGVTEVSEKDGSFHDVLKRADEAMYQAKNRGRNRVQFISRDV